MMIKAEVHKLIHSSVMLALNAGAPGLSDTTRNAIAVSAAVRAADPIAKAIQAEHDVSKALTEAFSGCKITTIEKRSV